MYSFGSGSLWGLVTVGAIRVPRKFGTVQEVSIDFKATTEKLFGQNQYPVAVARGSVSIDGKAKLATLNGAHLNDIFFGGTNATGQTIAVAGEAGTIPGTPFAVTVANSATWVDDLGVTFVSTGLPLTRVASGPTTGQYSVAAGVYTFAAADTTKAVLIDYSYTVATGNTTTLTNQLMGTAPQFRISLALTYGGNKAYFQLLACVSESLSFATKLEDFTVPDFSFAAFADASNSVGIVSLSE